MKKYFISIAIYCTFFTLNAQTKIGFNNFVNTLPTASTITGASIPIVQGGASKQAPASLFATSFQSLTDGPGSFTSNALNFTRVNISSTALEYRTPSQVLSDISGVPTSRTLTINGTAYDLSADRSWTIASGVTSFNSRTGAITPQSGDYTFSLINGIAQISQGGTGATSVTTSPTANAFAGWDSNSNLSATNFIATSTSTVTAAGTTTLTVSSARDQYFTGTNIQTCVLPVASTLAQNQEYWFYNQSTAVVTVQTSGGNTIYAMAPNSMLHVICINPSGGTGVASWNYPYFPPNPRTAVGDLDIGGTVVNGYATPTRLAAGTLNYVLTSGGPGVAPSWQPAGGLSGLTTNGVLVATSSTAAGTVADLVYGARSLTVGLTSSGTNTLTLGGPSSASAFTVNTTSGAFTWGTQASHFPVFTSSGTERFRINTTGNILINTTIDNSKLTINGSLATAYVAKSSSYTATISDFTIEVTATGQTITLPTAVGISGRLYTIKLTASGSGTVATTSSQTIDASTTYSLSAQYKYVTVQSNGANWLIVANN